MRPIHSIGSVGLVTFLLVSASTAYSQAATAPVDQAVSGGLSSVMNSASILANFGLLIAAVIALFVAGKQIRVARETEAINAYEKYHHVSLEYPRLANGFDHAASTPEEYTQYEFYVMCMLLTIERVMTLFPDDREWSAAFLDDVRRHQKFFCSNRFAQHIDSLDSKVVHFIECAARKFNWTYPYAASKMTTGATRD